MSLTSLLSIPRDDELACAKVRAFIAPSEPGEMDASLNPSEIIALTKPGNASGHPFTFQGNSGSHSAFASTMLQWIEAEFPPEN